MGEGEIAYTVKELDKIIDEFYPEGTDAEHNLMKLDLILKSRGSSLGKVLDSMKVEGSPFLKLPRRN